MVRSSGTLSGAVLRQHSDTVDRDPEIEQWLKLFENRIPKLLHHAIAVVPGEWYRDDIYELYARLLWRLESVRALVEREILRAPSKFVTTSFSSRWV